MNAGRVADIVYVCYVCVCVPLLAKGDTGYGWAPVVPQWQEYLPHVKFVLPHAPYQPVTLNDGHVMPSWFDLKGKVPNRDAERVQRCCDRHTYIGLTLESREDSDGIHASSDRIKGLVQAEIDVRKCASDEIVPAKGRSAPESRNN